jgi:hypothetical protein
MELLSAKDYPQLGEYSDGLLNLNVISHAFNKRYNMFPYRGYIVLEEQCFVVQKDYCKTVYVDQLIYPTVKSVSKVVTHGDCDQMYVSYRDGVAVWDFKLVYKFVIGTYRDIEDPLTLSLILFRVLTLPSIMVNSSNLLVTQCDFGDNAFTMTDRIERNLAMFKPIWNRFMLCLALVYLRTHCTLSDYQQAYLAELEVGLQHFLGGKDAYRLVHNLTTIISDHSFVHILRYPGTYVTDLKSKADFDVFVPPLKRHFLDVVARLKAINSSELQYFLKRAEYRILVIAQQLVNEPRFTKECKDDFSSIISTLEFAAIEFEKKVANVKYEVYPLQINSIFELIDRCIAKHENILFS